MERNRKELLAKADGRTIPENLKNYPMEQFSMFRDGHLVKSDHDSLSGIKDDFV